MVGISGHYKEIKDRWWPRLTYSSTVNGAIIPNIYFRITHVVTLRSLSCIILYIHILASMLSMLSSDEIIYMRSKRTKPSAALPAPCG